MKEIKGKSKCVVFDMDGTIFDSEKVWKNTALELNKKYNINIDDDFRAKCCGKKNDLIIKYLNATFPSIDGAKVREEWLNLVEEEATKNGVPLKPGFKNLINFLLKKHVKLGLATGSNLKEVQIYFNKINLDEKKIFDIILTCDDYKKSKPNPEVYKTARKILQTKAKNCLGIEDSANGSKACWRAGFNTILVPDVFDVSADAYKNCVGVFKDLNEVKTFLQDKI